MNVPITFLQTKPKLQLTESVHKICILLFLCSIPRHKYFGRRTCIDNKMQGTLKSLCKHCILKPIQFLRNFVFEIFFKKFMTLLTKIVLESICCFEYSYYEIFLKVHFIKLCLGNCKKLTLYYLESTKCIYLEQMVW